MRLPTTKRGREEDVGEEEEDGGEGGEEEEEEEDASPPKRRRTYRTRKQQLHDAEGARKQQLGRMQRKFKKDMEALRKRYNERRHGVVMRGIRRRVGLQQKAIQKKDRDMLHTIGCRFAEDNSTLPGEDEDVRLAQKEKEQHREKARECLEQAVEWGHVPSMVDLAGLYLRRQDQQHDGVRLLEKAARAGNIEAIIILAHGYYCDHGVSEDVPDARIWCNLTRDYSRALQYYHQGANLGNMDCCIGLGVMHKLGKGVPQDYNKAFMYFNKASSLGSSRGLYEMALLHISGTGCKKSMYHAAKLLQIGASRHDNVDCVKELAKPVYDGFRALATSSSDDSGSESDRPW